jgi:PAS domain S-box-containing protein
VVNGWRRHLLRVLVPLATVGAGCLLTFALPAFRSNTPLFLFLTAVLISAWFGGWVSGLLATALAMGAAHFVLTPATAALRISSGGEAILRWTIFVLIAVMVSSLQAARQRMERRLRHSEQRLSLAIDAAHLGVWDYNLITRHFWWSKTLEVIYGRTRGDFPNTYGQFFGLIHFDDQPLFNRAITRTIDEGTDYEIEHRILMPDRTVRWVNTRGRVFFNQASRAERIVGVVTDITERKLAETEIRPPNRRRGNPMSGISAVMV